MISPKYHPEVAGKGIEYFISYATFLFDQSNGKNDVVSKSHRYLRGLLSPGKMVQNSIRNGMWHFLDELVIILLLTIFCTDVQTEQSYFN